MKINKHAGPFRRKIVKLITSIFFCFSKRTRKTMRDALCYVSLWHILKVLWHYKTSGNKTFKYNVSICAGCKDEGEYFLEWIEYYLLLGVDHFYLYNNNGTDNTKELLHRYIDQNIVTWIEWPGITQQLDIYNDAIEKYKDETRWMAIVDLDEFIVPTKYRQLPSILSHFNGINQILIPWIMYGSSGHNKWEKGLVIERFTKHASKPSHFTKAILNPRATIFAHVHRSVVFGRTTDEHKHDIIHSTPIKTIDILQINHYVVKSYEEYISKKQKRGDAYFSKSVFDDTFFKVHDVNDVDSPKLMQPYIQKIKSRIRTQLKK